MKILNDEKFALLTSQANSFLAIQTAMVEASEGVNPEEITAESIIEALNQNGNDVVLIEAQNNLTEAQAQLAEISAQLDTANTRITALEAELNELEETPAKATATIAPTGDANGETETIAEFATKNRGNTEAILAKALKEGLI